jgi:RimJ/RimL family protein N-acetyltransferase
MINPAPVTLEGHGVRLGPLAPEHREGLAAAAGDGRLWQLWFTSIPEPEHTAGYIADALSGQQEGHMLPWAVRELETNTIVGSTRYHDIAAPIGRVNTACKLLLLQHGFDTLGCRVVGFRTDNFNFASQRAIEALGAHKDGVIRHHYARRDGTVRDSVMYSILIAEWPNVKRHLLTRLARYARQ